MTAQGVEKSHIGCCCSYQDIISVCMGRLHGTVHAMVSPSTLRLEQIWHTSGQTQPMLHYLQ